MHKFYSFSSNLLYICSLIWDSNHLLYLSLTFTLLSLLPNLCLNLLHNYCKFDCSLAKQANNLQHQPLLVCIAYEFTPHFTYWKQIDFHWWRTFSFCFVLDFSFLTFLLLAWFCCWFPRSLLPASLGLFSLRITILVIFIVISQFYLSSDFCLN